MSDWFSTALDLQREILRAQKAQMDVAQKMLDAGKKVTAAQDVAQKAAETNLKAYKAWAGLWGWK